MKKSEPAFPIAKALMGRDGETRKMEVNDGMSLRDYLAAKAMQAIIAKTPLRNDTDELPGERAEDECRDEIIAATCRGAYRYADAMLAHREEQP